MKKAINYFVFPIYFESTMIEILIVFSVFSWLMHIISRPYEKKIKKASSVEKALIYRRRLKWIRWIAAIVLIAIYVTPNFYLNHGKDFWLQGGGRTIICVLILYLFGQKGLKKLLGNVSSLNKESFLNKYSRFALFLRGFENDNYEKDPFALTISKNFSEYNFVKELKQYIPVCAIGMTKESDAPLGAQRIYVSDETWKSDVLELMNRSNLIFILLNDRPSCIWEIEQSHDVMYKTCFIINDIDKYNSVRNRLIGKIDFPDVSKMKTETPFALRMVDIPIIIRTNDGVGDTDRITTIIQNFTNSQEGYKELFAILLKGEHTQKNTNVSLLFKIFFYIVAFIVFFSLNLKVAILFLEALGLNNTVVRWLIVVFFYAIEWLVFMLVRINLKIRKWR